MLRLIDAFLALVAYLCVASVISLAAGIGYMWYAGLLNDEKVFQIVAILHDIDLQQIAQKEHTTDGEVPPEEQSLTALVYQQQVQTRNFEIKLLALQRARQEYDHRLQELKLQTERFDRFAQDWQKKLKQQEEISSQENLATVVSQLEQLSPEVAKESLMRWIDEGRMDDAILLMSKMSESKLAKILRTFETDQELDKLHEIHRRIISGSATQLQKALGELQALQGRS